MRFRVTQDMRLAFVVTLILSAASICCAQQPDATLEHLLQAAVHLEQADLPAQAAEVRDLLVGHDEQVVRQLLDVKLTQIEQLRREVALLQEALHSPDDRTKVILRIKVLELALDKLDQVGLNVVSIRQLLESQSPTTVVDSGGAVLQFLEMLQTQGFAECIAEPTLITRDRQRASLEIRSSERADTEDPIVYSDPAAVRRAAAGDVRFECTPAVGQLGLLTLDLGFSRSGTPALAATARGNRTSRRHPRRDADVEARESGVSPGEGPDAAQIHVEMLVGQTLIMASRDSGTQENQPTTATLLLLEAETVAAGEQREKSK